MIRVCVAGATGWVGRNLVPAIVGEPDLALTGAVAPSKAGQTLAEALGSSSGSAGELRLARSVSEALERGADVLVDYTTPQAVKPNVLEAISRRVHCVIGTSGLGDSDYAEIHEAALAAGVGVLAGGNFAITAILLEYFATIAARHIPAWEIIDYADATKPDAPSGTVRQLAFQLAQVRRPEIAVPIEQVQGEPAARGFNLNGSQVHSIRVPGHVIGAEVIFGKPSERLSLRYDAGDGAEPYVAGTLLGIRQVGNRVGLTRGLAVLLGLP